MTMLTYSSDSSDYDQSTYSIAFFSLKKGIKSAQMKSKLNVPVLCSVLLLLLLNFSAVSSQKLETRAASNANDKDHKISKVSNVASNQKNVTALPTVKGTATTVNVNCSLPKNVNLTVCKKNDDGMVTYLINKVSSNSGMLFRTMYVLLAVTGIVIIYFIIKAIRLRRRKSKTRKYGIITKQGDRGDMEMEPLGDGMDEDDDYTVFEMSRRK